MCFNLRVDLFMTAVTSYIQACLAGMGLTNAIAMSRHGLRAKQALRRTRTKTGRMVGSLGLTATSALVGSAAAALSGLTSTASTVDSTAEAAMKEASGNASGFLWVEIELAMDSAAGFVVHARVGYPEEESRNGSGELDDQQRTVWESGVSWLIVES